MLAHHEERHFRPPCCGGMLTRALLTAAVQAPWPHRVSRLPTGAGSSLRAIEGRWKKGMPHAASAIAVAQCVAECLCHLLMHCARCVVGRHVFRHTVTDAAGSCAPSGSASTGNAARVSQFASTDLLLRPCSTPIGTQTVRLRQRKPFATLSRSQRWARLREARELLRRSMCRSTRWLLLHPL